MDAFLLGHAVFENYLPALLKLTWQINALYVCTGNPILS